MSPCTLALLALFGAGTAPAPGHESTAQRFERSLDPRETIALAQATTLRDLATSAPAARRADECSLTLTLLDAQTGREVPGLVRVTNAKGQALNLPSLVSRGIKLQVNHPGKDWHVLTGTTVLALPPEPLPIEAFSGLGLGAWAWKQSSPLWRSICGERAPTPIRSRSGGFTPPSAPGGTAATPICTIYFDVAGRPLFDRAPAEALVESKETNLRTIQTKSRFENDAQRAEVTTLYRDAIEELRQRLQP